MVEPRLRMLSRWRDVVRKLVEVVKRLYPQAKVYLFGGAAEDRLTVLSDIDVMVVLPDADTAEKRAEALAAIWEALEKEVPPYYPLEVHVVDQKGFEEYKRRIGKLVRLA